ncbi:MAG: hypothetical protein EOL87_09620 [Spartobacteria bacterium]|nr:hypothetical protein [Spartobacteria bacterium]
MRQKRIKRESLAYYHCMTRVVGRQMLLGDVEKEHMRKLIRRIEGFTGVRVLTYALMTNHIHLLLEEPDQNTPVSDELLMQRLRSLYTDEEMQEIEWRWSNWLTLGNSDAVTEDKRRYIRRMHDISAFMKTLKHRFSFWFNRMHGRKGTLWEERFKSVLIQGGDTLRTVAAYIEMNPVRAGLAAYPSVYRFCGFGEAMGGEVKAQEGIVELMVLKLRAFGYDAERDWHKWSRCYLEEVLMYKQASDECMDMTMLDDVRLEQSVGKRAALPESKRLLCKNRYFTDGQVLGSKEFVEAYFEENRARFGSRRKTGGRKVRGGWHDIYAVRDVGRAKAPPTDL